MAHKLTSTQPEPARTRIYGSTKVKAMKSSNQPQPLPNTKVHGNKATRQIRVRLKAAKDKREMLIRSEDFNPAIHAVVK